MFFLDEPVIGADLPDVVVDTAVTPHGDAAAVFSPDRAYRYLLSRRWADGPTMTLCMLNPSTADAFNLDPTVQRCFTRAFRAGMGRLVIVNLFALRATKPKVMKAHPEPVGACNDTAILRATTSADVVIAGWGVHGPHRGRDAHVRQLLRGAEVDVFRIGEPTKDGHPRHPLFVAAATDLQRHEL